MLTSLQNPLVKQLRKLHRAKERQRQQLFLVEGTHLLEAACAVPWPLDTVCATPAWIDRHPELWQRAAQLAQRAEMVSQEVMEAIATTVTPDGVVATGQRSPSPNQNPWQTPASLQPSSALLGLALETLQDPGNLGTIIRTAAAAGVHQVWLSGDSVDYDHPKVLRASAGQWFRVPMVTSPRLGETVATLRHQGTQIIATLPQATQSYWDIDFTVPSLLLIGNEGSGLSPELAALADRHITIPQAAGVESLNAAIATALVLYEALRQRRFLSN
ncbi:MAG: RNA methyltransferase [Synechococcales bacterium]|nr:RNA methyltransferase [Synechococcales bacterium]